MVKAAEAFTFRRNANPDAGSSAVFVLQILYFYTNELLLTNKTTEYPYWEACVRVAEPEVEVH